MSRRHVSADEPGCTWEYGWDPEQQTFFARLVAGEDPGRCELARFGTRAGEIGSTDALMYLMGMRLPTEQLAALEHDRLTDSEVVEAVPRRRGLRQPLGGWERTFPPRTLIRG
jgi:hypothetical protein